MSSRVARWWSSGLKWIFVHYQPRGPLVQRNSWSGKALIPRLSPQLQKQCACTQRVEPLGIPTQKFVSGVQAHWGLVQRNAVVVAGQLLDSTLQLGHGEGDAAGAKRVEEALETLQLVVKTLHDLGCVRDTLLHVAPRHAALLRSVQGCRQNVQRFLVFECHLGLAEIDLARFQIVQCVVPDLANTV